MTDYFGYDVHFVMNITDIDDKVCIPSFGYRLSNPNNGVGNVHAARERTGPNVTQKPCSCSLTLELRPKEHIL